MSKNQNGKQIYVKIPVKKQNIAKKKSAENSDVSDVFVPDEDVIFTKNICSAESGVFDLQQKTVAQIIQALDSRFDEFDNPDSVLSHLEWLDASTWPKSKEKKTSVTKISTSNKFGTEDIKFVANHFKEPLTKCGFNLTNALSQFNP